MEPILTAATPGAPATLVLLRLLEPDDRTPETWRAIILEPLRWPKFLWQANPSCRQLRN